MLGRNHLLANIPLTMLSAEAVYGVERVFNSPIDVPSVGTLDLYPIVNTINQFWPHETPVQLLIGVAGIMFGSILPDIDLRNSTVAKLLHFYIPVPHRTITHTIWIPLLLLLLSYHMQGLYVINYIALGYLFHLFNDNFSKSGICYFWPITRYRRCYINGQHVRMKKHHIGLYTTGQYTDLPIIVVEFLIACIILIMYLNV